MKGLGLLTTPVAEQARAPQPASADSPFGVGAGGAGSTSIGLLSGKASFLSALDNARQPGPGTEQRHSHLQQSSEYKTPGSDRPEHVRTEERPSSEERPKNETRREPDERDQGAADRDRSERSRDQESRTQDRTDGNKDRPSEGERREKRNETSEKVKTDSDAEKLERTGEAKADAEAESKGAKKPDAELWTELARSMNELSEAAVGALEHKAGEKNGKKTALKFETIDPDAKNAQAQQKTAGENIEQKIALISKEAVAEKTDAKNAKDSGDARSEKGDGRRAENTARQVYGFVREGAPEKSTEQMLLDPSKWSVHGRAGATETLREGEAGKDSKSSKNAGSALRFDPVKAAEADTSKREGAGGQSQTGGQSEFSFLKQDLSTRLLENNETRQAALRESRELFNSLVQKARVNLGAEGKSSATIRLKPEFLGNMTLNLKVNGNQVEAVLLVDNQTARKLLTEEMEHMRQELRLQGIQIESFNIRVREPGMAHLGAEADENAAGENAGQDAAAHDRNAQDGENQDVFQSAESAGEEELAGWSGEEGAEYEAHLSGRGTTADRRVNLAV